MSNKFLEDREYFEQVKKRSLEMLLKEYADDSDQKQRETLADLFERLLNTIMLSERKIYLETEEGDKGNGKYERDLYSTYGILELEVPRTRKGGFRPHLLKEKYKRLDESYVKLLESMIASGFSESEIMSVLKRLGLPYSEKELERIKEGLKEELRWFKERELPSEAFALIIDGYHSEIREEGKVRYGVCYIVLGIDMEGKKDIYGLYTYLGKESRVEWGKVFEDLVRRGLKRVMVVVSDDLSGLGEIIRMVYPLADHQLCVKHLKRNADRQMKREDAKGFKEGLDELKKLSYEEALGKMGKLLEKYKEEYPSFVRYLEGKKEKYVAYTKYPEELRGYIYTTNAVESINSKIERVRIKSGGYFGSVELLELSVYLHRKNLRETKWRNGIMRVKGCMYELNQMFQLRYFVQTQNSP
ncbi:transposase mutator type [Pseudothermotoga thermarum DSM 5069]|uniref:Mutator family transposase n=1 Tax=Pseudothermotoga thermarum DSM 5069 TaxID=688269 RepID=F7YVN1_9THEM|nr:IS256 family transposase [Pseudothermotoga thermarum]AEH50265.1 transposase mutator type [Pseudothermotoga thermarum DSM 5069]AEH51182.1 transposase mutator type [Pseudothermotoga thermarum DSM 5069]AEH51340.1 transposase mutator type [Pseudothermotoga thermarum DSM 5069]AEH51415.1 transposase mutator type [Pseudothermotoga thermarum DSM 5069]AEH51696.1 transposase mutator type [Pseudothermotoga thermarum DSM 5069]